MPLKPMEGGSLTPVPSKGACRDLMRPDGWSMLPPALVGLVALLRAERLINEQARFTAGCPVTLIGFGCHERQQTPDTLRLHVSFSRPLSFPCDRKHLESFHGSISGTTINAYGISLELLN